MLGGITGFRIASPRVPLWRLEEGRDPWGWPFLPQLFMWSAWEQPQARLPFLLGFLTRPSSCNAKLTVCFCRGCTQTVMVWAPHHLRLESENGMRCLSHLRTNTYLGAMALLTFLVASTSCHDLCIAPGIPCPSCELLIMAIPANTVA